MKFSVKKENTPRICPHSPARTGRSYLIRATALLMLAVLFCGLGIQAFAASQSFSWYCVRRKDHTQPKADANMDFSASYPMYYVDTRHGDDNPEKVVYLTFDAGYENGNVEKILNVLKEEQVPGAFFVLGHVIDKNTTLIQRMFDEGHLVCNHTLRHHDMTKATEEEFRRELQALENLCLEKLGRNLDPYYRPPEGRYNEENLGWAEKLGYKTVFWSLAYADWDNNNQPDPANALQKIRDNIHNGAIILLHPTSATNAAILKDLIVGLKKDGYRFGTLNELTAQDGGEAAAHEN